MRRLMALALVVAGFGAARVAGQQPAFEAASIKLNKLGAARGGRLQPGRFEQTSVTLRDLMMATGNFTLAGFLPGSNGSPPVVYVMLRSLLTERFKLTVHAATEERPIQALVTTRSDKRPGDRLRQSDVDCDAYLAAAVSGARPPAPPPGARPGPPCSIRNAPGRLTGNAVNLSQLADILSSVADRPVMDRTSLQGNFDLDLEWMPALRTQSAPAGAGEPQADDGPLIFTALQEQLGLKLESTRGPVEILVVDHVDHPTEN